ncbi:hypothetical protein [Chondromyces crocatus]|uniref:Uncharacterized protein n=1 Tax=Chondromyces crocatus TaxID=52 RepID=A0A0K1ECW4_CHOCO|nr:hypothetical protein [Chondromyces crocatus]AKT38710.1 uncharacterized protein CMC5_028560 [Chondromyces crocatus]
MLMLPPSVRVYVAAEPTDLRKGFDGLSAQDAESPKRFSRTPVEDIVYDIEDRRKAMEIYYGRENRK